jgi:hypothetical protein
MPAKIPSSWWTIPAIALVLLWPALVNGYPFLFPDTDPYIRQGQQFGPALASILKGGGVQIDYLQARSGIFGAYLYAGYRIGDFWSIAVLQALMTAWMIWTTAKAFGASGRAIAVFAGVLALTTAPFEAVFMMPDAWTAPGILAGLVLLLAPQQLDPTQKVIASMIFLFFVTIHQTHLVLAVIFLATSVCTIILSGRKLNQALLAAAPLAALALAGFAVNASLQAMVGSKLSTFPFLAARMLEDGPGRKHLAAACTADHDAYELCKFADRDLSVANTIMFSGDEQLGAFAIDDRAGQIRMNEEQTRFFLGSILADPVTAVAAMFANGAHQLVKFTLWDEFRSPRGWTSEVAPDWGEKARPQILAARAYSEAFPLGFMTVAIYAVAILSLGFLAWRLSRRDLIRVIALREDAGAVLTIGLAGTVLLLIVANAFLCGAFSGAFERFQTRVIWLMPFAASLIAVRFGFRPASASKT